MPTFENTPANEQEVSASDWKQHLVKEGFLTKGERETMKVEWPISKILQFIPDKSRFYVMKAPLVEKAPDGVVEEGKNCGFGYLSNWNGSYHDAHWEPLMFAWAKGNHKFTRSRRMAEKAHQWLQGQKKRDSSVARFQARRQVRSGD